MIFEKWVIPMAVVSETERTLRRAKHEIFCIWTGPRDQAELACSVERLLVPEQAPESSDFGVSVRIEGRELARIQFQNLQTNQRSFVQLHTHPSADVRMSRLDRQREVVKHVGALSIIVPNYGAFGLEGLHGVAIYEREATDWRLWGKDEADRRLTFKA